MVRRLAVPRCAMQAELRQLSEYSKVLGGSCASRCNSPAACPMARSRACHCLPQTWLYQAQESNSPRRKRGGHCRPRTSCSIVALKPRSVAIKLVAAVKALLSRAPAGVRTMQSLPYLQKRASVKSISCCNGEYRFLWNPTPLPLPHPFPCQHEPREWSKQLGASILVVSLCLCACVRAYRSAGEALCACMCA